MKTPLAVAAATFLAHVAVSFHRPYEFFRDELYFIDCGRHPAFGYVDQPPLVPLLAAATQAFGHRLWLIRALPALGHAGTVLVAAALAALLADEVSPSDAKVAARARLLAAAAVALAPMYIGLHSTLNTTCFEALAWTFMAYATARAALRGERRWLLVLGITAGVALETKYASPFFLAPLLFGLVLGPSRRVLLSQEAARGAAAAVILALPSLFWQRAHGFPFRELLHAASHGKNTVIPPLSFAANQVLVMNPVLGPLWIAGVGWALVAPRAKAFRFLAVGFAGVFLEMMLMHGKDYYVAPAYGVAFALGSVLAAPFVRRIAWPIPYLSLTAGVTVIALPSSMPILAPRALAWFVRATHTEPQAQENGQKGAVIPPLMADMLAWKELETRVAAVWRALPEEERARTAIITSNYGEAGAINFYGPEDGLPRAISGHNQYWLWGPGDGDPVDVLRVNGKPELWKDDCAELTVPATFGGEYVMPYERDRPILQCRQMNKSLRARWGNFKHYE